jgi:hypothetical protein
MANISINGLTPAGSALFAGSETFLDSVRDLSEAELGISGGGGYGYGGGGGSGKSGSKGSGKGGGKGSGRGSGKGSGGGGGGYSCYCHNYCH